MLAVLNRTLITYILLLISMRILGKRQLGQLELSELITTILISEIASAPITNIDKPLYYATIPLITIVAFEVVISLLITKFPNIKNIFSPPPSILIYNGRINQKELFKNRISTEELISELRVQNITDVSHVQYAILEQNGLLSIIPKIQYQQPTLEQSNIQDEESGIAHIIISQGMWNDHNIRMLNLNKADLEKYLQKKSLTAKNVFLFTVDDKGSKYLETKK